MDPDLALEPDLMDLEVFYKFWVIGLGRSYGPKFRYSFKVDRFRALSFIGLALILCLDSL
jgi:hypothetical protein